MRNKTIYIKRMLWSLLALASLFMAPAPARASGVPGDLNDDMQVNVSDVTFLIDVLLNGEPQWTQDVNGDGKVNIGDVTSLITYLLSGGGDWPWPAPIPGMPSNGVIYTVNGYSFVMVPIQGGTFMMGSTVSGEYASPVHQVTLSDYSIGMTEVTIGLWKAVTGSYPSYGYIPGYDSDATPIYFCSWDGAKEFIARLNEVTGLNFRLPTEAQWEFAARGGNLSHGYTYAGSNNLDEVGWYTLNFENPSPSPSIILECMPVAQKAPNELGLYDMSGNVSEFCEDNLSAYAYPSAEPQTDPVYYSPQSDLVSRVVRGGNAYDTERVCTVTNHSGHAKHGVETLGVGFRLAL